MLTITSFVLICSVMSNFLRPQTLLSMGILHARVLEWGAIAFSARDASLIVFLG